RIQSRQDGGHQVRRVSDWTPRRDRKLPEEEFYFLRNCDTQKKNKKESGCDDRSIVESQPAEKQSSGHSRKRKSTSRGPPAEITEAATDSEVSEAESHVSGVSSVLEAQEPIIRITRKRRVIIMPTPKSSVRKKQKISPQQEFFNEGDEGVVSEAESHASGVSMVLLSTERSSSSRRNKAKSQRESGQDLEAEAVSDAESTCSGMSTSGISSRRPARNMQKKLQAQAEKRDTKIISADEKQITGTSINIEDSDTRQTSQLPERLLSQISKPDSSNSETYNNDFDDSIHRNSEKHLTTQNHQHSHPEEEKQASAASPMEIRKENSKSLDDEDTKITEGEKFSEKDSQLNVSEVEDNDLEQSVPQTHSSTPESKAASQPSSPHHRVIMKSLEHRFAVVKIERLNEETSGSLKMSNLPQFDDLDSNGEPANEGVSENNSQSDVSPEYDAKLCGSELNMSQDSSVLLFLSSDESQQSENSENGKDAVCSVDINGQEESPDGDLEDTACGSALFVIDRTPGLSADKNFYLEDKAPREVALEEEEEKEGEEEEEEEGEEEEEEEEVENSEEESSDSGENKDESSDEEDLLSDTKSKLLKLTSSSIDPGVNIKQLGGLYINFNVGKQQPHKKTLTQIKEKKKNELLQKAVITLDFEKSYCVPPYSESKHQLQKQ
ncbi:deoxynucleotidyltransferase terminal-interacting protein 2, partial [Sigmodon hispidus]